MDEQVELQRDKSRQDKCYEELPVNLTKLSDLRHDRVLALFPAISPLVAY
jgi:hypothetical protein